MHTKVLLRLVAALQIFLFVHEQIKYAFATGPLHMLFLPSLGNSLLFLQISSQMAPWRGLLCHLPVYKIAPFLTFILLTLLYVFSQHYYHLAWYIFICLWLSPLEFRFPEGSNFVFLLLLLFTTVLIDHLEIIFGTNQAFKKI